MTNLAVRSRLDRATLARRRAPLRAHVRRAGGLAAIALSLTGCSMAVRAARMYYDASPVGTEEREWGLRRTMASGAFDSAPRERLFV